MQKTNLYIIWILYMDFVVFFTLHCGLERYHSYYPYIPGPRLNIKTVLSTYGDFHVKDKTAVRTSYL